MTAPRFIPYAQQTIDEDDIAAVADVLRSDFLTTGPKVAAFEAAFAEKMHARHAIVVSSGTAALHVAVLAAGCAPGQTWIVPSVTFVATANAVRYCGGDVLFADVDGETGLMRPADLQEAIDRANRKGITIAGVLPVHLGGQVEDMPTIRAIARENGLMVIEDAAHALGSRYGGDDGGEFHVGACAHSDLCVFSMHPVKTIAMGEGGAITTNSDDMAAAMFRLRTHGLTRDPGAFKQPELALAADGSPNPWYYEMQELGLNYRATDIHCALGLSQLGRLSDFVARRQRIRERYANRLAPLSNRLGLVPVRGKQAPAWHLASALIDFDQIGRDRAAVMAELHVEGIGTQVHYIPVHWQPYYRERYGDQSLPGAESYYRRCLSLPLFASLSDDDVDRVTDALARVLMS